MMINQAASEAGYTSAVVTLEPQPCRDTLQRVRLSIGGLEDEIREVSRKMDDVLARAARDFEDDPLCRQDITKDAENEIAIAQCCGGILTEVGHHPRAFLELGRQHSQL